MTKDIARDRHHRKARCIGGGGNARNISNVRTDLHRAYHKLFGHGDPEVIVRILNTIWIDPKYELVVRERDPKQYTFDREWNTFLEDDDEEATRVC